MTTQPDIKFKTTMKGFDDFYAGMKLLGVPNISSYIRSGFSHLGKYIQQEMRRNLEPSRRYGFLSRSISVKTRSTGTGKVYVITGPARRRVYAIPKTNKNAIPSKYAHLVENGFWLMRGGVRFKTRTLRSGRIVAFKKPQGQVMRFVPGTQWARRSRQETIQRASSVAAEGVQKALEAATRRASKRMGVT